MAFGRLPKAIVTGEMGGREASAGKMERGTERSYLCAVFAGTAERVSARA